MKITLIGAGNLATHLGRALFNAGHSIIQVFSRTQESAEVLAMQFFPQSQTAHASLQSQSEPISVLNPAHASPQSQSEPISALSRLSPDADIYIIAVKDSALAQVIPQVCSVNPRAVFVHTAGSMSISCFDGYASHYGVFYPMQTFSKARQVDFSVIPCFLEASDLDTAQVLKTLADSITSSVFYLDSDRRRYLHLAAVFACNFTNHCYALAQQVLQRSDLPFDVMLPLIDETAAKVHQMSPCKAQTGPAVRYDQNVMDAQIRLIADDPLLKDIYERMSMSIHQYISANND